jgi:ADP-ribosylglycohydrolase
MNNTINDSIMAAFVADALSLGVHWVYDTSEIKKTYGRLEKMVKPELATYHNTKEKGEFTHYGDQMLILLESVAGSSRFDLNDFGFRWQALFSDYNGYIDNATTQTLANIKSGESIEAVGAGSDDLAGASRLPPLILAYRNDLDGFIAAAKQQTAMTHNHEQIIKVAEWTVRSVLFVLKGDKPSAAIFKALDNMPDSDKLRKLVEAGFQSREEDTLKAIADFGQMCSVNAALPSTVHLIAKYENNYKEAMVENIMAGGDSAARGIIAAFIIGAGMDNDSIPTQWIEMMKAYPKIKQLLQ